jgi:hypothetical protein
MSQNNIHTNSSTLCAVLKNENFQRSEGPSLEERLKPDQMSNKFGKIEKKISMASWVMEEIKY